LRFGNKTLAELSRSLAAAVQTNAEMDNLYLEHSIDDRGISGGIEPHSNALVRAVAQLDSPNNERVVAELIRYVLEKADNGMIRGIGLQRIERLRHSLNADGFEWRDGNLVPVTPESISLANELSALERNFEELGLNVALTHYRQAHESFVAGNWEAANGQTRSFLENLFIELNKRITARDRDSAGTSLQDLRDNGFIDPAEFQMIKGFWDSIQDNGPHHGLSDEQEALFRLHVATSIARYLIHRLRSRP
jgi:hypothetical protein